MAFVPEGQADSSQARRAPKVWTFVGVHIGRFAPKGLELSPGFQPHKR
jgi:hypothetical protein